MKSLIRIEHSNGIGLFNHDRGVYLNDDFHALIERYHDFPQPYLDLNPDTDEHIDMDLNGKEWFCAFKSIVFMTKWITDNEILRLLDRGFKIYYLEVEEYQVASHQTAYTKESIRVQIDITEEIKRNAKRKINHETSNKT